MKNMELLINIFVIIHNDKDIILVYMSLNKEKKLTVVSFYFLACKKYKHQHNFFFRDVCVQG